MDQEAGTEHVSMALDARVTQPRLKHVILAYCVPSGLYGELGTNVQSHAGGVALSLGTGFANPFPAQTALEVTVKPCPVTVLALPV